MIPLSTPHTIRKGDQGVHAWAVQRALNSAGLRPLLELDGAYGAKTKKRVGEFQATFDGVLVDGVFGPTSSRLMSGALQSMVNVELPIYLMGGIVTGESGNYIAAVNWSVAGGVDCGYTQRRVLEASYNDDAAVQRAFDSAYQFGLLGQTLRGRHDAYYGMAGASTHERAWRLAVLYHNYQYAAQELAAKRWPTSYALAPQTWVMAHGLKFPDGHPVKTPMEWCERYSLGNAAHDEPGQMVKDVDEW